jgi:trimeric autotransporter adhesin
MAITIKPDSPLKVTTTEDKKTIQINKSENSVNLTTETTSVVNVTAQGPRGQKGDTGATGAQGAQGISAFSGSAESSSISTRLTTAESELGNTLISSSAQIASDISGSFISLSSSLSTRLTTDETNITNLQTDSGSFSTRLTTAEQELENTLVSSSAAIDHDQTTNFVANEHIDHSSVTLTAGDGLSGGGDITTNRSFAVDATVLRTTGNNVISSSAQISSDISGSFTNASSSFSTRITAAESELGNTLISSSAQISSDISGSFTNLSSSLSTRLTTDETNITNLQTDSGSFSTRITTAETELSNTLISSSTQITELGFISESFSTAGTGILSSSIQIASDISGSFTSLSSSLSTRLTTDETNITNLQTDSGSFSTRITTEETNVDNLQTDSGSVSTRLTTLEGIDFISSSAQISSDISGSFTEASSSFSTRITTAETELSNTLISSSAQISSDISGSFTSGFEFTGTISGSSTSTGSFGHLIGGQTATINGFTFPTTDGTDGQAIVTDGSGVLTFDDIKSVAIVKNISGVTLQKGTPVHATGSVGNTPTVIAASASDATTMPATFVLDEQLVDDAEGRALLSGFINGVNTVGFVEGGIVYVGENGGYTQTKPTGTNLIQNLGIVTKIDSSNGSGYIYGSGRSNDVPNLLDNTIFYGSGSNQMQQIHISGALQDTTLGYAIFNDRVEALSFTGSLLSTNGVLSSSAQIASDISGSFTQPSSSFSTRVTTLETDLSTEKTNIDNLQTDSGSFSTRITTAETELNNTLISSSAQIASDISGSFGNQRVGTTDNVNFGSVTTTGNVSVGGNLDVSGTTTSIDSATLNIGDKNITIGSGSTTSVQLDGGGIDFGLGGTIANLRYQHSTTSITSSVDFRAPNFYGIFQGALSSSAQISSDISGSFTAASSSFSTRITTAETELDNTLFSGSAQVDHDLTTNFVSNEHIDHTSVTLTAGDGLSGGGDITTNRSFAVDATVLRTNSGVVSSSAQIASDISGSFTDVSASLSSRITSTETGNITSVTAGTGLTGGGSSGGITLNVVGGDGITANADDIQVDNTVLRTTGNNVISSSAQITITESQISDLSHYTDSDVKTKLNTENVVSGSAQISSDISGSFVEASASFSTRITTEETNVDNLQTDSGSFSTRVTTNETNITNLQTDSGSFSTRVTTLESQDVDDDLTIAGDTGGNLTIDLDSETLTLAGGTGVATAGSSNTITFNSVDSEIVHDNLSGFVSNEHIDHSSVSITAGNGLTGGGTIASTRTINVGAGDGISVAADSVAVDATVLRTTGDSVVSASAQITHDSTTGFVANEHIDHSSVSITAGSGLTGGGTIVSTRTINVGAGDGISVAADSVAVDTTVLRTTGDNVVSSSAQIASDISGSFTAGTGLDLSSGQFSVDVSDFMSNGVDNRVLTAAGTDSINAESNVTYDSGVFKIAGNNSRAGLTLQTGNNTNDRGIGFMNSGGSYNALIYVSDAGSNQGNIVFSTGTVSTTLTDHTPSMTLDSSANLNVVGDVVAYYSSDKRLKDNIIQISNPIEKIKSIGGYEFDWNDNQSTYEGHDIGVIAQEIEEVLPELVTTRNTGYKAVKYEKIIALLIEGIKEQQKQIDELKNKS